MKLCAEAVKALATPEIRDLFEAAGMELAGSTPEQFTALIRRDIERFTRIAREANIHPE